MGGAGVNLRRHHKAFDEVALLQLFILVQIEGSVESADFCYFES